MTLLNEGGMDAAQIGAHKSGRRIQTMRKGLTVCSIVFLGSLCLAAQGHNPGNSGAANTHSNAPAGTPAASSDRDTGTARASDVGKGKHKGLPKAHKKQSKDKK
jgi:hypothetical protein